MPILVFRDGGQEIGEVPRTLARSITGNEQTGSVVGFEQKSRWKAPIISIKEPDVRYRSPAFITRRIRLFEANSKPEITGCNFVVSGSKIGERADRLRQLRVGQPVRLVREAENPQDSNAILVSLHGGGELGYVPRDVAEQLAPQIDSGKRYDAVVSKLLDTLVPVIDVRLSSLSTEPKPEECDPLPASRVYRLAPVQSGPSAGLIAALIIIVILGAVFGFINFHLYG